MFVRWLSFLYYWSMKVVFLHIQVANGFPFSKSFSSEKESKLYFTYNRRSLALLIRRVLCFLNESLFLDMEKEDMLCHLSWITSRLFDQFHRRLTDDTRTKTCADLSSASSSHLRKRCSLIARHSPDWCDYTARFTDLKLVRHWFVIWDADFQFTKLNSFFCSLL